MNREERNKRDQEIVRLYCERYTQIEIGERLGITHQAVGLALKRNGISAFKTLPDRRTQRQWFTRTRLTTVERFWSRVDKREPDECWPWLGKTKTKGGYGTMSAFGTCWYSHHMAWYFSRRKKASRWILHRCGNADCCNPAHLYDGTPKENVRDRWEHARLRGWTPKTRVLGNMLTLHHNIAYK